MDRYGLLRIAARPIAVFAIACLAACGGGGDGDGDGGNNPPPGGNPPPPPTANDTIVITQANAALVSVISLFHAESVLQLGYTAALWFWELRDEVAAGEDSVNVPCPHGGTRATAWQDLDADAEVSIGDRLVIDVNDCYAESLNARAFGRMTIDLVSVPQGLGPREHGLLLEIAFDQYFVETEPTKDLSSTDPLQVTLVESAVEDRVIVSGGPEFRLVVQDGAVTVTERLLNFRASKNLDYVAARYRTSIDGEIRSQVAPGRWTVHTLTPLSGFSNAFPEQGGFEMRGASNSRLRVEAQDESNLPVPDMQVDNGNGTFVPTGLDTWDVIMSGFVWWDPVRGTVFPIGYIGEQRQLQFFDHQYSRIETPEGLSRPAAFDGPIEDPGVELIIHNYFARPVLPSSVGSFNFQLQQPASVNFGADIPGAVDIQGALISVSPATQLKHGAEYQLEVPEEDVLRHDGAAAIALRYATRLPIRSDLTARGTSGPVVAASGQTVQLSAASSHVLFGPAEAFAWEQLSGPAVSLANPDAEGTSFVAPVVAAPQTLEFKLTVTDQLGHIDATKAFATVVPSLPQGMVYVSHRSRLDLQMRALARTPNVTFITETLNDNHQATVRTDGDVEWTVTVAGRDGEVLGARRYDGAISFPSPFLPGPWLLIQGPFPGTCQPDHPDQYFEIHEIEFTGLSSPDQAIARVAFDYQVRCADSVTRGGVRWNSTVPMPPL